MNKRKDKNTREKADKIASEMREILQNNSNINIASKYFYEFRMFAYDIIDGRENDFNYRKYKKEREKLLSERRI